MAPKLRPIDRIREELYALKGRRSAVMDGPNKRTEFEVWVVPNTVLLVQVWKETGGFDIYAPLSASMKIEANIAAIRERIKHP